MKVSIITVCLNSEKTVINTLKSVLSQNYKNIEHIIIDGGSTDKTLSILKKYPFKNKKIIIKKNSTIYEAMNEGIKNSKGELISILNSDDFYNNDKGFGFIIEQKNQDKFFFHVNGLLQPVVENDIVTFELEPGLKGMNCVRVKK